MAASSLSIARPYAKAIFELAMAEQAIGPWQEALKNLAEVSALRDVQALLKSPWVEKAKLAEVFVALVPQLPTAIQRFLALLANKRRLSLLPHIYQVYRDMAAQKANHRQVTVTSAQALNSSVSHALIAALERRFTAKVDAEFKIDPALIGGAVIQAGDYVIDGSLRGQLKRLAHALHSG